MALETQEGTDSGGVHCVAWNRGQRIVFSNGYRRRRNKGLRGLWKLIGKCAAVVSEGPRNVYSKWTIAPALETRPEDRETGFFAVRAAHTTKGNASLLEFNALHDSGTMWRICWISAAATSVALSQK